MSDQAFVSEITPEILSIQSMNAHAMNNAPARCVMFGSHFSQRPVIDGSEPNQTVTGVEEEMGKYTFSIKMPEDGTIVAKIMKYSRGVTEESVDFNPETLVIYQSHATGEFGCFTIPYYCSHDPVFGFKYDIKSAADKINAGADIPKGTIFADSPAVKGDSHYTYGKMLNLAYMSHPNVGLDGYVVSRDALPFFKFRIYEKRTFEFGSSEFPLNTYGDDHHYKPFPDIGDYVKESGLLAVLRRYDPVLAPALTSVRDAQRIDYHFDTPVFARTGVGRVVDVSVIESTNSTRRLPAAMTHQLEKYKAGYLHYYREILNFYETKVSESWKLGQGGNVRLTRPLHNLIVQAMAIAGKPRQGQSDLTLIHKKKPLDVWRVEFVVEYEITPDRGFKLSCSNGGKGVICRIEEPENMPVDADGNRADIITGPDSVPGRMNLGRLHGPFFNAAARDVRKQMLEAIGLPRNFNGKLTLEELQTLPAEKIDDAIALMLDYYKLTSIYSFEEFTERLTVDERWVWLLDIFNNMLRNYFPIGNKTGSYSEMVKQMEFEYFKEIDPDLAKTVASRFKMTYGPVTYVGHSGKPVTTRNNIRIAPISIMLLDKIADSWLASDIGKHSNLGIVTAMNRPDKHTRPWRRTAPRVIGETEGRLYCNYGGQLFIAELMDRNGNIATQREMPRQILRAENPSSIPCLVDRDKIKFNNTRPLQIVNQFNYCLGIRHVYRKEQK